MAAILESVEIKKKWPIFNSSQKNWEDVYGIFLYPDQNGYQRLAIDKNRKRLNPVYTFHFLAEGHTIIRKLIKDFNLCPKLCFIQKDHIKCEGVNEGTCYGACEQTEAAKKYNKRVSKALESLQTQPSFAIIDTGRNNEEQSCILVLDGKFYGMGFIATDIQVSGLESIKELLTEHKENSVIQNMVNAYAARFPEKIILFENVMA
jgi:DNA polymerase-3 subunit epsilon